MSEQKSHLVVIVYDDEYKADEARIILRRAQGEGLIALVETAVVVKAKDGKLAMYQDVDLVGKRKTQGRWLGVAAAVITEIQPLILVGTVTGALVGKLMDKGIKDGDMRNISHDMTPGTSALLVLATRTEHRDAVAERLRPLGGKIAQTTLNPEAEAALTAALEAASPTTA